jgi:hypothetical protein
VNRNVVAFGFGAFGVLSLIALGGLCMLVIFSGPKPRTVLARAQPVGNRIVAALEEYHRRRGSYPPELADLVNERLLPSVPELPSHWGTSYKHGPDYEAHAGLDFYRLSFGYLVHRGIGPGDDHYRVFVSDDPRGWRTTDSTGHMEDLVADRVLTIYRKRHDGKSLDLFMSDVIGKADCDYLYRSRVVEWLGKGTEIDLPADVSPTGTKGYVYQAEDERANRYCFVYKDHWLQTFKSHRPNDFVLVDKNYPVLDKLFLIEEKEGREMWTDVRACPESPRDKPSGEHELVDAEP